MAAMGLHPSHHWRRGLLSLCLVSFGNAQSISCPAHTSRSGSNITLTGLSTPSATVVLANTPPQTGVLCTLSTTQLSEDGLTTFYIPVGRSYDGNDWERVAGKYDTLAYDCSAGDDTCTVTLPDTDTSTYTLTSYLYTLNNDQTSARFFERASFGPTTSLLGEATTEAAMASWVKNQLDTSITPLSSHREYFRTRLNPRSLEMYKYGKSGPHPCEVNSRWRSFAFTRKDTVMSTYDNRNWPMTKHNVTIESKTVANTEKYLIRFGPYVRTILSARPQLYSSNTDLADGDYPVCAVDEMPGDAYVTEEERQMYAKFSLIVDGSCQGIVGGNPKVLIDPTYLADETPSGGHILDFSSETASLQEIGTEEPSSVLLFSNSNYYSSYTSACDALPDPDKADFRTQGWEYSPFFEKDRPTWGPSSRDLLDPPVYALLPTGEYMLNDRRLNVVENTPTAPIPDGGGTTTIESVHIDINADDTNDSALEATDSDANPRTASRLSGDEQAIFCSNGRPNIFNEKDCKLSTEANACMREDMGDEDTISVVTLTPTSLDRINTHTGTTLFQVDGLDFTANVGFPCTAGETSRWKVQTGLDKSACDALGDSLASTTYATFETLLYYSVSDNSIIRDIIMYEQFQGMVCDNNDASKTGFGIYVTDTSTCFLNVHPEEWNVYQISDNTTNIFGSSGTLTWTTATDASLTMTYWETQSANGAEYNYYGRTGDVLKLETMMEMLGIYTGAGGLPVTRRPTSTPSESPSSTPSTSGAPSEAPSSAPSSYSDAPSISFSPSSQPSLSGEPSSLPSSLPSDEPSSQPSTLPSTSGAPSSQPSTDFSAKPSTSASPSLQPSIQPSSSPSLSLDPSSAPSESLAPTSFSEQPSSSPSISAEPSSTPSSSNDPSVMPSVGPSASPSRSQMPSSVPTATGAPSSEPSQLSQIARTINDNAFNLIANDPLITDVILETQFYHKTGGVLVCGSIGEIKPDPTEDDYFDYWNRRLDSSPSFGEQKKTVWTKIALHGVDQLRQRIAFALSQIFAISPDFLSYSSLSEAHMFYYDIFVRNAGETYRDVLKNVAFAVKMGMQLSHVGSSSVRFGFDASNRIRFPDENYAREVMQLETIGLEMLNMDGTVIKDDMGLPVPTYDINDVLVFSRAWTGFNYASRRGNYEELDHIEKNWMDPMTLLNSEKRDWFPKRDLHDKWIGHQYPLCYDMPDQAFLKSGATFKLLGRSSSPRYQFDREDWDGDETIKRMVLHPDSNLYSLLCAPSGGTCTFPSVVELTSDVACHGMECAVNLVRVVQLAPNVFYEYVRRPCVHLAFFENAKTVFAGSNGGYSMCAHPSMPVATTTCCPSGGSAQISCNYIGEKVTYDENNLRCGNDAANLCPAGTSRIDSCGDCCTQLGRSVGHPKYNHFQWTNGDCSIQIKVRLDSMVAIVHTPDSSSNVVQYVSNTVRNMNFFHVTWPTDDFVGDELFPTIDNNCGNGTCIEQDDWTCLCDVAVTNTMAFSSEPTNAEEIRSTLSIGAFEPEFLGSSYSAGTPHSSDNTVTIYHLASVNAYSEDTIFELPDEFGNIIYLKNLISTINVGDNTKGYYEAPLRKPLIMTNPLTFFDLVGPEVRDAFYETDAVIDHLISHPNTAPFVSKQLIQHFGVSNPSPRYVEAVATAFKTGSYSSNGINFGGGELSDLQATVAAILLDREATSSSLDADPAYGAIREPVIKVLAFMRAMDYVQTPHDRNIYPKLQRMVSKVGQMAHESPDQFSFFLPDYLPPGQFAQSMLFAPPAQVLTLSTTIGTVEGFFSLVRNGLNSMDGGFGPNIWGGGALAGDFSRSVGYLNLDPSGSSSTEKIQSLADLLTSGRLSSDALSRIVTAFDSHADSATKVQLAQQLIATSPEFHTTNLVSRTGAERHPSPTKPRTDDPYKAIVVLHLSGGWDSFGVLAPHHTCDLYSSYRKAREVLTLNSLEMDEIVNDDPEQPCSLFGISNNAPVFKEIYDNGHGMFVSNVGHLSKLVTKRNWYTETRTHLFSHKTMEREAQLVDAFQEDGWSTGVLGRMLDVLQRRGLSVVANGIDGKGPIVEGNPALGRTVDVIPSSGINTLSRRSLTGSGADLASIEPLMKYLNEDTHLNSGLFANYWAQNLIDTLDRTEFLSDLYSNTGLANENMFTGEIGRKLAAVSRIMLQNEARSVNRDVFYLQMGGFDGHSLSKETLANKMPVINSGISAFYKEMSDQNLLDSTTFVIISEFGRTITPNSGLGSDHAWGGNAYLFGGQVKGSRIIGSYPQSFDNTDPTNMGRGRLIPSTSWDAMWYGIANWFGITSGADIDYVLPNNGNFGCRLFTDKDMYTGGNTTISGCNDREVGMKLSMFINEPRYLTGLEQKKICKAAIALLTNQVNVTSRCIVVDQQVIVSFDSARRRLFADLTNTRHLQDATFTVESTLSIDYDDASDQSGTELVENVDQMTQLLNDEITANCTGECDNQIGNVAAVLAFEADVSTSPSSAPSLSLIPSSYPSGLPSVSPSSFPSESPSAMPSGIPSSSPSKTPSMNPSESPSSFPSHSPSAMPSGIPSLGPSSGPSASPSAMPSGLPSLLPSSNPSPSPSIMPSAIPSRSPSALPSGLPSLGPSTSPSLSPSALPSEIPSRQPSSSPSVSPSASPSEIPSRQPSSSPSSYPSVSVFPSATPSAKPSLHPSLEPSVSSMPSLSPSISPSESYRPSDSPSSSPSSRPSRDCPFVPETCGFGIWSPFTCECKCVYPYCPQQGNGACFQSFDCPVNYHETVFEGCSTDCPYFKYGDSCASSENVPRGIFHIYGTKQECCTQEFPSDSAGCIAKNVSFDKLFQLRFNGRFTIADVVCPSAEADIDAAAAEAGKIIFTKICSSVPNLSCGTDDKILVTKFCGQGVDVEASTTSRRSLQSSSSSTSTAEFSLFLAAISEQDARNKDTLLNDYLQGGNLENLLAAILIDILATSLSPSLQSISAIYYEFVNSFVNGLGLYYPDWGGLETCLSDGEQPEYMSRNPEGWLYETLDECCERYYGWERSNCIDLNEKATLISSSNLGSSTSEWFYPDWGKTDKCINDGNAPEYMKNHPESWMLPTLKECCDSYYSWVDAYDDCLGYSGSNVATPAATTAFTTAATAATSPAVITTVATTANTGSEAWYVDWTQFLCVKSCEGPPPCGGEAKPWNHPYPTAEACCQQHLSWLEGPCST